MVGEDQGASSSLTASARSLRCVRARERAGLRDHDNRRRRGSILSSLLALEGGGSAPSLLGVECGTPPFWGLTLSMLVVLFGIGQVVFVSF